MNICQPLADFLGTILTDGQTLLLIGDIKEYGHRRVAAFIENQQIKEFRVQTTTGPMRIAAKSQEQAEKFAVDDGHRLKDPIQEIYSPIDGGNDR